MPISYLSYILAEHEADHKVNAWCLWTQVLVFIKFWSSLNFNDLKNMVLTKTEKTEAPLKKKHPTQTWSQVRPKLVPISSPISIFILT